MRQYGVDDMKRILGKLCEVCLENREMLTELDGKLGDGDMGISMGRGAEALRNVLEEWPEEEKDLTKFFLKCALEWNQAAPSTLGTLLSFGMTAAGREMNHRETLEEAEAFRMVGVFAEEIAARGKAKEGDKTILDALCPCAETLERVYRESGSAGEAGRQAAAAARAGMERTKGMEAKTGRASWLKERNKEYPDAGAVLCALAAEAVAGEI